MPLSQFPKYKRKEKESIAWLFIACIKVETDPLKLLLRHANSDFLRRFLQTVKLGTLRNPRYDLNTRNWELTNPQEVIFLLTQIESHIHTQADRNLALALIEHIENPTTKTETKLKRLAKKHNINFYVEVH